MQIRRGLSWRQPDRIRPALIATLIAVPLAAGVVVGVTVANHAGQPGTKLNLSAQGSGIGHHHHHRHWRPGDPGSPIKLNQTPTQAAASMECTLQVPARPLTAQGLATPYVLGDGCTMSNPNLQAFVEADIINPATGAIRVYNPLVITAGTTPAAAPVRPRVRRGEVVALMVGFNGASLMLTSTGDSLEQGHCVNGLGRSLFTQVAYCNSPAFFAAARRDIARGRLKIPALGTGSDGQPCPDVRSFAVVDQDQSDNVVTTYLLTANGQTAQDSAGNAARLAGATAVNNGSDNALVNKFMDPALGCKPFQFYDRTAASSRSGSQITDELLAAADQGAPAALVPMSDPMTQVNGRRSTEKTNLFRAGVGQPPVSAAQAADSPATYCRDMMTTGMTRTALDKNPFSSFASPVPATGSNLYTFLAARLSASFVNLGCGALLNAPNPVSLTLDSNGVAVAASFRPLAVGTLPGGVAASAAPNGTASPAGPATPTPTATATATPTATAPPAGAGPATPTPTATPASTSAAAQAATGRWPNRIGRPHHI